MVISTYFNFGPKAEIPDDAGSGSGQETMGQAGNERGLQYLTPEEQAPLVAMPECLVNEIGFRAKLDYGEWVIQFFERYTMQTSRDCKFETHPVTVTGPGFGGMTMYVSTLVTPSLYNWRFQSSKVQPTMKTAELSACKTFYHDPRVVEIVRKVPPAAKKVRRRVNVQMAGKKKGWAERGISCRLGKEEAKQALFEQFCAMGCRSALWDGNL